MEGITPDALTASQFADAFLLAGAYGHRWANTPSVRSLASGDGFVSLDAIREVVAADIAASGCDEVVGGIHAPTLVWGETGSEVHHQTGSGRLTWKIGQDGRVRIDIYRPGDVRPHHVLSAAVGERRYQWGVDPAREVRVSIYGASDEMRPHARHLGALHEALATLVGFERAWEIVLPYADELGARLTAQWYSGSVLWHLRDETTDPEEGVIVFPSSARSLADAFGQLSVGATLAR